MSLREIARFTDVYEAELASAFLASHGIDVFLTERFQTTVDPLMQRALGIRLLAPTAVSEEARALLARARTGEFASDEGDDLSDIDSGTRTAGTVMALAAAATGGFWGTALPRRFRPLAWQGMLISFAVLIAAMVGLTILGQVLFNPPRG